MPALAAPAGKHLADIDGDSLRNSRVRDQKHIHKPLVILCDRLVISGSSIAAANAAKAPLGRSPPLDPLSAIVGPPRVWAITCQAVTTTLARARGGR